MQQIRYCQRCGKPIEKKPSHSDGFYAILLYCCRKCALDAANQRARERMKEKGAALRGATPLERFAAHNGYTLEEAAKLWESPC